MSYQKINMLPQGQILEAVKKSPFAALSEADAVKFFGLAECCLGRSGACVRSAEKPVSAMYMVIQGKLCAYDGLHQRVLRQFGEGECAGLFSLAFPGHASPELYASEDTVFLFLDSVSYRMIELSDPKLSVALFDCIRTAMKPAISDAANLFMRLCH